MYLGEGGFIGVLVDCLVICIRTIEHHETESAANYIGRKDRLRMKGQLRTRIGSVLLVLVREIVLVAEVSLHSKLQNTKHSKQNTP